jgi:hypothetical protein
MKKRLNTKDIDGQFFSVPNAEARLALPVHNAATGEGFVTVGSICYQQADDKIYRYTNDGWVVLLGMIDKNTFDGTLESGVNYTLPAAVVALAVTNIVDGSQEANIKFTVSGSNFTLTLPQGVQMVGEKPTFADGETYIMSYFKGVVVFGKVNNYQ